MSKDYFYAGELIEPTDKAIGKKLTLQLYAQVLAHERPNLSPAARLGWVQDFETSIDNYFAALDNASEVVRIDDLKASIESLTEELEDLDEELDGLSADEIDYAAFERRNLLRPKLKHKKVELKELRFSEKKLHNKDLRFLLAAELMLLVHQKSTPDPLTIAQQTQDYWDARQKRIIDRPPAKTAGL